MLEQQRKPIQLLSFEYREEVGSATEHQGGDLVEDIYKNDWHGNQRP